MSAATKPPRAGPAAKGVADARPRHKKGTGGRQVYEAIREKILSLEFEPGSDLEEAEMVRHFHVSRTPIRESFIRLASERLVVLLPNRGARVASLSLTSVREFFEALMLTQRAVTRWAAIRGTAGSLAMAQRTMLAFEEAVARDEREQLGQLNREFHMAIAACSQNTYITRVYGELLDEGMRLTRLALLFDPPGEVSRSQHIATIIGEHRDMFAAVSAGMADRAEEIARLHTERFRGRILDYIRGSRVEASTVEP